MKKRFFLFIFLFFVSKGWTLPSYLYFPKGWSLNTGTPPNIEKKFEILDDTGSYTKSSYAFVRGHLMSNQFNVLGGDELEISFYAKDSEEKNVSCLLYTYSRQEGGALKYSGIITGFTQKVGKEWTNLSGVVKIPKVSEDEESYVKGKNSVDAVIIVMASNTGAYFDYPVINYIEASRWDNIEAGRYQGRGQVKYNFGQYSEALQEYNQALKFAVTSKDKEQITASIEEAKQLEKLETTDKRTENIFPKIDLLIKQKKYRQARAEYEKLKKLSDNRDYLKEISLFNIAELYRLTKDYKNVHKTYQEIYSLPNLTDYYRIYGLFRQAEVYIEQKNYSKARDIYGGLLKLKEAGDNHIFKGKLFFADTYRVEQKYRQARAEYEKLLIEQESKDFPNESYRKDILERLNEIEGIVDGKPEEKWETKILRQINGPKYEIYVSLSGKDGNRGTKTSPFATLKRAQEEVRKIKQKGLPNGGVAVILRQGRYFLDESIVFTQEDSGIENSPIVYRSYPGEEVRLIGGKPVTNFTLLTDKEILKRLPLKAHNKVWVSDLKTLGITDYGTLLNRGHSNGPLQPASMELFYNEKPMKLARWPKDGWKRTLLVTPEGDLKVGNMPIHKGLFKFEDDRPNRWKEEKDIWAVGYFMREWDRVHTKVISFDTEKGVVTLSPDIRHNKGYSAYDMPVRNDAPYYFYNILSELSAPEEFYVDRETGKLYFYPPKGIKGQDIIVSTLDEPILNAKEVSNIIFFNLTVEVTRRNGIEINGGSNNIVAGSVIRNTGDVGIVVDGGWNNIITGCDIYETGEGAIKLNSEGFNRYVPDSKLIPGSHIIKNNHIYRYNRFSFGGGGGMGINLSGIGNIIANNLLHDSPYICIMFDGNDNLIEYNEIYDVMNEARDGGGIYTYGEPKYLLNRGNVLRYNFIHHLTEQSSPVKTHQVTGIYVDALNGGVTKIGNIFYRCTERAMFAHGPDNRIENNVFMENQLGITLSDRSWLLDSSQLNRLVLPWVERLGVSRNKFPPRGNRYPQLSGILETDLPFGKIENNSIERNICVGSSFMTGVLQKEKNTIKDNWEESNPFFMDVEAMDFRLRIGSPVFGVIGADPILFEKIGVYDSPLRASWPVNRLPAGKFLKKK
ncbi:right-handed parallel beta-helix repeat-containing protein [bacterium]|nr:right-handed parallel beta-helix repeat-containing protein [bacterium]